MDQLLDVARSLLDSPWLLVFVLLLTVIDCLIPPVPSDEVIIAVAALSVASGETAILPGLLIVALTGALVGDSLVFGLGRRLPRARARRWPRVARWLELADRQFARRGARIILTARFLPVVRIGITLVAGGAMPYRRWLPLGLIACLLWATMTVTIGGLAGIGFSGSPVLAMVIGMSVGVLVGIVVDRLLSARSDSPPQDGVIQQG